LPGVSNKEQRQYEHIKEQAKKGRYRGREEGRRPHGDEATPGEGTAKAGDFR
jgi:hypothetical protein